MDDGYRGADFEWWYFHFISNIKFNIIIHPTDMYGSGKASYVSVSILEESGEKINFKQSFDLEETSMFEHGLCIKNDEFYIEKVNEEILVTLALKNIKVKLNISKIVVPELFDEKSVVLGNKIEGLSNSWLLVVPHSTFSGVLQYSNKSIQLKGWAYHDHNWGNWLIHDCYDYWLWGNFQNKDHAVTYYYLVGSNGEKVKLLNVICQDVSVNSKEFSIVESSDTLEIAFNTEIGQYTMTVYNKDEFKSHTRKMDENLISYSRYASVGELRDYKNGTTAQLEGINESLRKDKI